VLAQHSQPKTKIICTIGPKTKEPAMLAQLMEAGMNVCRLNFSHGSYEYHGQCVQNIKNTMSASKRLVSIMLDTKGPEIRTGMLKDGQEVLLKKGATVVLTTDYTLLGDENKIAISYAKLPQSVIHGSLVMIEDGLMCLFVEQVLNAQEVRCTVINGGSLGEKKNVNLPGVDVDLPVITEKDIEDLKFGVEQGVDFIAASFVRSAEAVYRIREVLGEKGKKIRIISKIESQQGLDNFDEILNASDGIMVARGDLGVQIPLEQVALAQKMMIKKCNLAGKIVVTATQMLESMVKNPSPTRAEASDVANAVFDGTDCVMLSGETAKGDYPIEAVKIMSEICLEAEANIDYQATFNALRSTITSPISIAEAIASSAVKTAYDLNAALLIVLTESGGTARFVAKYRPQCPILCLTPSEQGARQLLVSRGVLPLLVVSTVGTDSLIARAIAIGKKLGMCKVGDVVVATAGTREGVVGTTNNLKVVTVDY